MFDLDGVRHGYGGRTVLRIPSLHIASGGRAAVVGPNGAGKSTLLRLLAGLEAPTAGTLLAEGRAVRTEADRQALRRRATLVEQRPFLFRGTVLENVAWGLRARGAAAPDVRRRVEGALAALRCEALAGRDVRGLSDGEAQRVAVARAVATEPDALLLDEPASGADRAAQQALTAALAALQAARAVTVCVATHQLEEAWRWADRVVTLHAGEPTDLPPENLFRATLPGGGGLQRLELGRLAVDVMSDRSGPVTLLVPANEIVLSAEPLHSSARNAVRGRITRIAEQGEAVRVTVEAGVDLVALVTRRSAEDLGLRVGAEVWASFKSVAVRVV